MIFDYENAAREYALCYADKTRIRFIETFLSTFNASKGKKTPFVCFPRQKAFLKAISETRNVVAIKPRQCGITTLSSAWVTAQCVFASTDSPETVLCIANKLEQAQEIIIKIREFLEQVPRWKWGEEFFSTDPKSPNNSKSIFIKDAKGIIQLFNGCRIIARASGPNAARGISAVSVLILDEAAFIEEGPSVYATASATMASNPNSKTVMVSTPNGMDELYYKTYRQALDHENNFTAVQFRWYQDPRFNKNLKWTKKNDKTGEEMVDTDPIIDDEGGVKYDEKRWEKLERAGWKPTSPWYEEMCRSFNNDEVKIAQELDVSFMGSSDNVVASKYIEMQERLNVREPLDDFNDPMSKETWFWKKPADGHRYIMGVDPSRGVSADNTAIEIIDMDGQDENGLPIIEQVGEYIGKKLGDYIGAMVYQYATLYNNAFVVVDCTGGQGDSVVLTLLNLGYKNLYYEDSNQKTYTMQNQTKIYDSYSDKLPGFHFQGNRYPVLSSFAGMVRNNEIKVRSVRVIHELDTWIFKGDNGRMDHQSGSHDDTICALAMALFVMKYTLNKIEERNKMDKAILSSYMMSTYSHTTFRRQDVDGYMTPKQGLPFYNERTINNLGSSVNGSFMWLLSGYK
jgi:hypothetical protein